MKISKLTFTNVYGINEQQITPTDINIISCENGLGKTSILDGIQTAISNEGMRSKIIKRGEAEATMYIETDTGLEINRKKRDEKSDYISIKNNGAIVSNPETYLKNIFSTNQFNPIKDFIDLKDKEKSKTLLSICHIDFPEERYIEEFGELPADYNPNAHVLENLESIQSKNGKYYKDREETNRTIAHKKASMEDLKATLPNDYNADMYRNIEISNLYEKYHKATEHNKSIDELKAQIELKEANLNSIEGKYQQKVSEVKESYANEKLSKQNEIKSIDEEIRQLELKKQGLTTQLNGIDEKLTLEIVNLTNVKEEYIQKTELSIKQSKEHLATLEVIDAEPLKQYADNVSKMKEYLRDYDKIVDMTNDIKELQTKSDSLTVKIEHARKLPMKLLETANMPIDNVSIENGEILINKLPIDCLNEGEAFKIAIEVAKAKVGELKVILVDGFEKFCTKQKELFIEKARESGLQWFIAEVSDKEELTIISL